MKLSNFLNSEKFYLKSNLETIVVEKLSKDFWQTYCEPQNSPMVEYSSEELIEKVNELKGKGFEIFYPN